MLRRSTSVLSSTALCAIFVGAGCGRLFDAAEEEIEDRARQAAPGEIPEEPPVVPEDPIQVNSVLPNRGEIGGGLLVEVVGLGFEPGMSVWFGAVQADPARTDVLTDSRIQVVTPPAPVGVVPVYVAASPTRFGVLEAGFEYFEPVSLESVTPGRGPSTGGDELILVGTGFVDGTTVRFGTGAAVTALVIDSHTCQVTTPPLPHAVWAVTVSNLNGSATLPAAYATWDPVRLSSVTPFAGPLEGGTAIVARGTGFVAGSTLVLGGQSLAATPATSESELYAVTLAAVPATEGPVDATVSNDNGSWTLRDAFVFVDTTDPTPRVFSVTPATGLVDGGREVHIVGAGFNDDTDVFFGTTPANCDVIDGNSISCLSPAAPEGTVDVRVTDGVSDFTVPGAFTYIELRLDVTFPGQGAIAGNTWVDLRGNGFGADASVRFDGSPARAVTVIGRDRLTLRTPPHPVGGADVTIATQGVEVVFPDAFTFFDPYNSDFWSSGGAIDGAVNVTVQDWDTGARIPGAFVMLGTDPATEHQGFTDERGQLTLSGPDVQASQTVTAGKVDYALFSWVDVNAQNLTLLLMAAPEPSNPQPQEGPPPPVVRGMVKRIKDEYNTGDDIVLVITTYQSFSIPLPDPGPLSQVANQGPYELWSRTGDMVVLALAGTVGPGNRLIVRAMGFHPFLFTESGSGDPCDTDADCDTSESCYDYGGDESACTRIYEGIDIVVDTPLKQPLLISLDDPPLADDIGEFGLMPDTTAAFVYYDFGYMGLWPMADVAQSFTNSVAAPMPRRLPGALAGTPFYILAGAYVGWDDDLDPSTPPLLYPPQTEVSLPPLVDTTQPVLATPVLGTTLEREPAAGGFPRPGPEGTGMRFAFTSNKELLPSAYLHVYFLDGQAIEWLVLAPGSTFDYTLPVVPDVVANLRLLPDSITDPHIHYWQMMGQYKEGVLFNALDPYAYFDWRSRAIYNTWFVVY